MIMDLERPDFSVQPNQEAVDEAHIEEAKLVEAEKLQRSWDAYLESTFSDAVIDSIRELGDAVYEQDELWLIEFRETMRDYDALLEKFTSIGWCSIEQAIAAVVADRMDDITNMARIKQRVLREIRAQRS